MQIFKLLLLTFIVSLSFTMSGCQGDNSDPVTSSDLNTTIPDSNTTLPPIDINATTAIDNLSIINGNVIEITGSGVVKDIYMMAFNTSGATNTEGSITFQYPLEFITDGTFYGLIDPGTATVVDGRIHFTYTAPDNINDINGTRVEFLFYDTTNADVNVSLFIDFNLSGNYVSTDPVLSTLILSDTNLTINTSNQSEDLTIHAFTDQSTTNINTVLDIKYPQNIIENGINIGTFPATLNIVDGIANFSYKGVSDIQTTIDALNAHGISNPIKVNIYDATTGSNVDLNLNFEVEVLDPKYNNYVLNLFPENNISITENAQEVVLEVYLEDNSTALPVANESIIIDFFDISQGSMNSFSGITDTNGHIAFNYSAPADITVLDDFNISFKLSADVNNVNYTTVRFKLNGTTKDYTGYTLATVPTKSIITRGLEEKIIDVYLENNNSRPAANETILITYFSGENGTLDKFSALTDENGHASFIYTAPENLDKDGSEYNVTINIDGIGLSAKQVTFSILQDTAGILNELSLLPDTITVLKTQQSNLIKILTLDANRVGVSTDIVIQEPSIDGVDYGTFTTLKVTTNEDGYADINFTAPVNIDNLDNRTIIFRDVNTLLEHNLTISYEKSLNLNSDLYEIGLVQDNDIAVDSSGEVYLSIFKALTPTELINSGHVYDVNVSTRYGDKIYFDANDTTSDNIIFSQTAEQGFAIYTKQQASVIIIDVTANIFDGEKNVTIRNSFPVVINSGELSSISMFYASTELDPTLNIYTDYYTVHAVDKFGNPVNSGTVIHPTLVNGVKHSSLSDINGSGELVAGVKAHFADATQNFSDVEASADRLIVLPSQNQTNKLFFGNWEIESVGGDLNLTDKLDENSSISLKYVIGNENRIFTNNGTDSVAVANVQAVDGIYETDNNGNLSFKVIYDPALRGEKVYIAANAETQNGKIGIAIEAVLSYTGKRLVLDNNAFSINNIGESVTLNTTLYDEAHVVLDDFPKVNLLDFNNSIGSYSIGGPNNSVVTFTAPEKLADLAALQGSTHTFKITLEETENIYETVTVTFPDDNNYTNYSLKIIPNDFIVTDASEAKQFKVYILDANGDIVVNEQLVADFFDTKKGSMSDYFAIATSYFTNYATFTYIAPDDITNLANTAFDFNITMQNDKNITAPVKVNFLQRVEDINYTDYNISVLESNITIRAGLESHVIDIYLEGNDNKPASDETILLDFFNGSFGSVNTFSVITDANGHAAFSYTSPSDLSTLDRNTTVLTFKMDNYNSKDVNVTLIVDTTTPVKDFTNYVLSVVPTDANITVAGESKVIDVYLENNVTNRPLINETILLDFFSGDKGTMNSFTGVTDANGHVAFNYTAPSELTQTTGNFTTLTFTLDGNRTNDANQTAEANVTLGVNTTVVVDPKYDNYVLTAYPEGNVTIRTGLEESVLEVYLEDNVTNLPVSGENVVIEFFSTTEGTLDKFSATTDTNGHIAFNYTAPESITNGTDLNVTFKLSGSTDVNDTLRIDFNTTAPIKDYTDYRLSLVDVNRTIISASQVEVFDLYLEDNSTGIVKPAVGDVIVIDYFAGNYGTVDTFSATTDSNGHVQFTYTAPVDLVDVNDTNIIFRIENTTDENNTVSSTFTVSTDASLLASLQLVTSEITLSQNAQTKQITVLAFNGNGEAFDGGFVSVRYPTKITDDNVSGGLFSETSVNIVNGQALFNFIGPDPLVSESSLNFTFVYSKDSDKNTTLTVKYIPAVPKIVVDDGNITVTQNGELVTVNISVYDENYAPYQDGNIKIKYPASVLTGKDIGSFNTSSVVVVDGKVSFLYTAPNPLDGNDSALFTFYHDAQPALSEKDFNVSMVPDANQTVLTNYDLNATYETSMKLETSKGMTFYVEDDSGTKIPDSNVTSITVTVLNASLATLEDTEGNTGSSLSVTDKNNVQINLKTNTISGVVPVQVLAEFKDANNADQNLTKVFNVVILSGPPTAMSLSYASTSQNSEFAKFIENWVLTVTDKYNNLVNTTPAVSMGALIGYADSSDTTSNAANYLYYPSATNDGNLTDDNPDHFTSSDTPFDNVDLVNDKLVLFGGVGYKFNAYGKWDLNAISASNQLELTDDYNGSRVEGLGYTVGHNFRNEVCSGNSVVANVYAKDGNNILSTTGSMIIQVEYDYYLTGKSVVLWTNLVGENNNTAVRVGLGRKITLRAEGLESDVYSVSKDYNGTISLPVKISNTVEKYQNGNFEYAIKVSNKITVNNRVTTSMSDIYNCALTTTEATGIVVKHNGTAYVDVNITNDGTTTGTIQLVNILPSNEF